MPNYRLYFLDAQARIVEGEDLDSKTDAEAEALAETRSNGRDVELWCGARLVRRMPAYH